MTTPRIVYHDLDDSDLKYWSGSAWTTLGGSSVSGPWTFVTTDVGTANAWFHGVQSQLIVDPVSDTHIWRRDIALWGWTYSDASSTVDMGYLNGTYGGVEHYGSGLVTTMLGSEGWAWNAFGSAGSIIGSSGDVESDTGAVDDMMALAGWAGVYGGTVTNLYGIKIADLEIYAPGVATNRYGLHFNSFIGSPSGDDFVIYSTPAIPSFFAGKLNIGEDDLTNAGMLDVKYTQTDFASPLQYASRLNYVWDPSAASVANVWGNSIVVQSAFGNANAIGSLGGVLIQGLHQGSGDFTTVRAAYFQAKVGSVAGTGDNLDAIYIEPKAEGGTVTNVRCIRATGGVAGATVTNSYGIHIAQTFSSGSIVNRYGLYIGNPGGTPSVSDWAIYSASSKPNYLGGQTFIGENAVETQLTMQRSGALQSRWYNFNRNRYWRYRMDDAVEPALTLDAHDGVGWFKCQRGKILSIKATNYAVPFLSIPPDECSDAAILAEEAMFYYRGTEEILEAKWEDGSGNHSVAQVANANPVWMVEKSGTQATTGSFVQLSGWVESLAVPWASFASNELTISTPGIYKVAFHVNAVTTGASRGQIEVEVEEDSGGAYARPGAAWSGNYNYRDATTAAGATTMPGYPLVLVTGDKIRLRIRDIGVAANITTDNAWWTVERVA